MEPLSIRDLLAILTVSFTIFGALVYWWGDRRYQPSKKFDKQRERDLEDRHTALQEIREQHRELQEQIKGWLHDVRDDTQNAVNRMADSVRHDVDVARSMHKQQIAHITEVATERHNSVCARLDGLSKMLGDAIHRADEATSIARDAAKDASHALHLAETTSTRLDRVTERIDRFDGSSK